MSVTIDTKIMDDLVRALKGPMVGRIGVLGGKTSRTRSSDDSGTGDLPTNAEIGAEHEFGSAKLPRRSWLRMPLTENFSAFLEANGAFNETVLRSVIAKKNIRPWLQLVMATAEEVVLTGFDTGGFGKWKPSNMAYKKTKQTLVETQQLRNSVSTEIVG